MREASPPKPRARRRAPEGAAARGLARAARGRGKRHYVLRLYVTGLTGASARAIERVQLFCNEHLDGRYSLEVVDIYQLPALARDQQILATPTLIKVLPRPLRRFIGDLSNTDRLLFGLDLREG